MKSVYRDPAQCVVFIRDAMTLFGAHSFCIVFVYLAVYVIQLNTQGIISRVDPSKNTMYNGLF